MQIPKEAILHYLRERGEGDKADRAERRLPDSVDTEEHADVLSRLGVDPDELVGMADKIPGLRDKLGSIL